MPLGSRLLLALVLEADFVNIRTDVRRAREED
jgi:hypothetical protein